MTRILTVLALAASLAACATPQGKKLASTAALPPVAAGPATKASHLTWINKGEMVNLKNNGTITVVLDSIAASGNSWRLSEIPDATVLTVASHEYIPSENASPQGSEKWVFQAVGSGDIKVNMWYGKVGPQPLDSALSFNFIVSVE
jgi:predicted secreted protein